MENKLNTFELLRKEFGALRHTGGKWILESGKEIKATDELLSALDLKYNLKSLKKQEIEKAYLKAIEEPIVYNDNTFQADLDSQKVLSQIIAVAPDDFEIDWLDIDNNVVHLKLDDLKAAAGLILVRGQEMFAKKVALKKQLEEATTKDEINKIVWG